MFTDTMDVNNIWLENFVYQGGDDCVAIKPRSYKVNIRNATCRGSNGIAIESLGQYLEGKLFPYRLVVEFSKGQRTTL
jgi:galacturan 1,4-alpha-galacturonidase